MEKITLERKEKINPRCMEAYYTLQKSIRYCGKDIKSIVVTSCVSKEGKTSVSFNLALELAKNSKTVFVDADMRNSVLQGRYGAGKIKGGLTEYLIGQEEMEDVLYKTDIENLDIIFAGEIPPNPNELLAHKRFDDLLEGLREKYEYIIIDTTFLDGYDDAVVAAKKADGTVLVITKNVYGARHAQKMKCKLEKENIKILGAVLNKVPVKKRRK